MALASNQQTSTQLSDHLEQVWRPRLALDTSEEQEIANKFQSGEVDKFGSTLNIRIVKTKTTNVLAATADSDTTALAYEKEAETNVQVLPTFIYTALAINKPMQVRMLNEAAYSKAVRTQFLRSMAEYIDVQGGVLGYGLSQVVGSGAANIDRTLLLQAMGTLRQGCKREWGPGKNAVLRVHPKQIPYLYSIDAINNANLRGDSSNPNVTGVLVEAWGLDVGISGNVQSSGGAYHNMLFVPPAFVLAYNAKPQITSAQDNGLTMLIHGFAEFGVKEIFDAYAVDIQTSTA